MGQAIRAQARLLQGYDDGRDVRHLSLRIEGGDGLAGGAIPGQFCLLGLPGRGAAPFSFVSVPDADGRFVVAIHRCGGLSDALFAQAPGALLDYRGPLGDGWPLPLRAVSLLMLAEERGLLALAAAIDEAAGWAPPLRLRVLYGAAQPAARVLAEERRRWGRALNYIEAQGPAESGQAGASPLQLLPALLAAGLPDEVFCAGPEAFTLSAARACQDSGVAPSRIWLHSDYRLRLACAGGRGAPARGPVCRYDLYLQTRCEPV